VEYDYDAKQSSEIYAVDEGVAYSKDVVAYKKKLDKRLIFIFDKARPIDYEHVQSHNKERGVVYTISLTYTDDIMKWLKREGWTVGVSTNKKTNAFYYDCPKTGKYEGLDVTMLVLPEMHCVYLSVWHKLEKGSAEKKALIKKAKEMDKPYADLFTAILNSVVLKKRRKEDEELNRRRKEGLKRLEQEAKERRARSAKDNNAKKNETSKLDRIRAKLAKKRGQVTNNKKRR
jgi:hypothetical protein